jgi:hypothetical protein
MMRDDTPARAIPAGFYVGRFAADVHFARVDSEARASTTANRSRTWNLGQWVSRTGILLAAATGVLGGMAIGQLESIGGQASHALDLPQHVEAPRITVAATIAADPSTQPGRTELDMTLVGARETALAEARAPLVIPPAAPRAKVTSSPAEVSPAIMAIKPEQRIETAALLFPTLTLQERARTEKMVARGQHLLEEGSVALAREFFRRAAEAGLANGAFLLAATYDFRELIRLRVLGVQPNATLARSWYERARQLGAGEADARLAELARG